MIVYLLLFNEYKRVKYKYEVKFMYFLSLKRIILVLK